MKKYCKEVSILDESLIIRAITLATERKTTRTDVAKLLSMYTEEELVAHLKEELSTKHLTFPAIRLRTKIDSSNGKVRKIGIQNIKHQIYDMIASLCLEEMTSYIGEHQYSRKGKSPEKGIRIVERWLRNKEMRCFAKLDIKKCYDSIDKEHIMIFLNRHIKNDDLLWLIWEMIDSYGGHLSIGSNLSQRLCDLFLAQLYHEIQQNMYMERRGKRIKFVKHTMFYRDDIILIGSNVKNLHKAVKLLEEKCKELGVELKPNWRVQNFKFADSNDKIMIDIMGYRAYRHHTTIRRSTFKKVRRAFLRAKRRKNYDIRFARRIISYYGKLKHTDSFKLKKRLKAMRSFRRAKRKVRIYDKSKIRQKARKLEYLQARRQSDCMHQFA